MSSAMKRTRLFEEQQKLGAVFTDFAGWELPVYYSSILKEHFAVREGAGLFDVSHMGRIRVRGSGVVQFLNALLSRNILDQKIGEARYALVCNPEGGVKDDIIAYHQGEDQFLLVVNASNREKILDWMDQNKAGPVDLDDQTENTSLLAVQGPRAEAVVSSIVKQDLSPVKFYTFSSGQFMGEEVVLSRTGYTGEDGFEVFVPNEKVQDLWRELLSTGQEYGILPAGLGARDLLRLEMGYPLYGHELTEDISPLEAGLERFVDLDKGFIGREALLGREVRRSLVGLRLMDSGVPREGFYVYQGDRLVGQVTSGGFSPTLKSGIALALLDRTHVRYGENVDIEIRGKRKKAQLTRIPFIEGGRGR
ncbi:aminomethyltransferase [Candidatus Hakubella thermalkaliphila]|uniref:Aminomethyltransferase n=4 Tax=Candidatus Hakubella thermalkaliphila TaxID=2754717 RepID=A0A6V8Q158_9ACTN|nr:aminomethyltransferase [Candidatus Hakubella thermalkaliphila]GFP39181.1 aminomethyltransferase [Candidatus Hakubella thermalkaliphila]